MKISKQPGGDWLLDVQPGGRSGPRIRKRFKTKAEALEYATWSVGKVAHGEWRTKREPSFGEVVAYWAEASRHLRYYRGRWDKLRRLEAAMPVLTPEAWTAYQASRQVAVATKNRDLAYTRAAYKLAIEHGVATRDPLERVKLAKVGESRLRTLTTSEIFTVKNGAGEAWAALRLCLATGARVGEVIGLTVAQVSGHMIRYESTKGGRNRAVPVAGAVLAEVQQRCEGRAPGRRVYEATYDQCHSKLSSMDLPKSQATHVMRHTFAEHYLRGGGSLRDLQQALGHASIQTTMKYSHFEQGRMEAVARLNPLMTTE
jgi:site-specific recombinase XerD